MGSGRRVVVTLAASVLAMAGWPGARAADEPARPLVPERTITYVGVTNDQTDFAALGLGATGYWFPQFDREEPVEDRPTGENARASLPEWVAPFTHLADPFDPGCGPAEIAEGCIPTFFFRTFSQDGPALSKGGQRTWNDFTLPDGTAGRSGAIVDPHTAGNTNNTINRIQLRGDVPTMFHFHVVTDNTNLRHDPRHTLTARGNVGPWDLDIQVEADSPPEGCDLRFNGLADVYTFRFEGFVAGDYIKLRLHGADGGGGASFGGLMFDERFTSDSGRPSAGRPTAPC